MKAVMPLSLVICALIAGTTHAGDNNDYVKDLTNPIPYEMEEDQSRETVIIDGRRQTRGLYTTTQTIDFHGICRYSDQDIDVNFPKPSPPAGYKLTSATIELSYGDADFNDQSMEPMNVKGGGLEVDIVSVGDSPHALDVLKGINGTYKTDTAIWGEERRLPWGSSQSIRFRVNIDALNDDTETWCLVAHKATFKTLWQEEKVSY